MIVFKKLRWKNFLSTGNTFTEVDLTSAKTNLIVGVNGAGKSTILDALTFSLFGKPFRKINKPMLVNSVNAVDCQTEIEFQIGRNEFKIVRGIKPGIFEVWQNGVMLDQSSTAVDYQKQLEQNILKMNYKSFTQIVVLGSSTFVPFMRLPVASRREIIEDILDIQIFSVMNQALKEKIKCSTDEIKDRDYQIDMLSEKIQMQSNFIEELDKKNQNDILDKDSKISILWKEEDVCTKSIENFSSQVKLVTTQLSEFASASTKLRTLNNLKGKIQQKFSAHKKQHQFFSENTVCPTCSQEISEDLKTNKVSLIMEEIVELNKGFRDIEKTILKEEEREETFIKMNTELNNFNSQIHVSNNTIRSIQKQIKQLQTEIELLQNNQTDSGEASKKLKSYESEFKDLKKKISVSKEERDCLLAAAQLLKDNGIKTRIIKRYLPSMNKLINQYLQNMDFYVNFTLNENFEETIKSRHRDIFSYESFSEGEKARIDIALLLTWRSIAKLKNSVDTNILILDEIFDGSLDQNGTGELGWILGNFDDNTNVYVISHKESMEGKFDRTLQCEKIKNFSTIRETVSEVD